jgi:hypothetical protein
LGSSLDGTKWATVGSPNMSVSGSLLTLTAVGAQQGIIGYSSYGVGYEMRLWGQLSATWDSIHSPNYATLQWVSAGVANPSDEVNSEPDISATFFARQFDATSGGAVTSTGVAADSATHLFTLARTSAGGLVASVSAQTASVWDRPHTGALYPCLLVGQSTGGTASVVADWLKVRPYVSAEPSVSAATLQSAGGLRWEPITSTDGTVLVDSSGSPIMALVAIT